MSEQESNRKVEQVLMALDDLDVRVNDNFGHGVMDRIYEQEQATRRWFLGSVAASLLLIAANFLTISEQQSIAQFEEVDQQEFSDYLMLDNEPWSYE